MLVLSRKRGEKVIIGDGLIELCVVDVRDGKVRLGFTAPADISVHRLEIWNAIQRDRAAAEGAEHDTA